MKVSSFLRTDGACDYYRADLPLGKAKLAKMIELMRIKPLDVMNREKMESSLHADILLFPRVADKGMVYKLRSFKEIGKKIVVRLNEVTH